VVKVIKCKAASPPHMDGWMMFTRWHANVHLHLIHACFGPPESTSQTASQSVQPLFAHLMAESPYTLQWTAPFFFKIGPLHGGSGPPSNTWFLEPTQVHNTNGILISSAVFFRAHNRDRPCYSVCNNRPHLANVAMQPNNGGKSY